jgi:hypothetical protein
MAQTLQTARQVARVVDISDACQTVSCLGLRFAQVPLVNVVQPETHFLVVLQVILLTLLRTVVHLRAPFACKSHVILEAVAVMASAADRRTLFELPL